MKTFTCKSVYLMVWMLLLWNSSANAQDVSSVKVHVENAGTLSTLITDKLQITNLTLTGQLNGSDVRFIREMAGKDYKGASTKGKLTVLDISRANIVEGGDFYCEFSSFDEYYTSENVIGDYMFYQCNLATITIPNSAISIGKYAFTNNRRLTSLTIPANVANIGEYAFYGCSSLHELCIEEGEDKLDVGALSGASSYQYGDYVFYNCPLDSVHLGRNVDYCLGYSPFKGKTTLNKLTISNRVTSIGNAAFRDCTGLTSVTIPTSITEIKQRAFQNCTGLVSITIPDSVARIGRNAFAGCTGLASIYSLSAIPCSIDIPVFETSIYSSSILYIPSNSLEAYRSAEGWKEFLKIVDNLPNSILAQYMNPLKVYSSENNIVIENANPRENVYIYNTRGALIKIISTNNSPVEVALPRNEVYIVRTANKSVKVNL